MKLAIVLRGISFYNDEQKVTTSSFVNYKSCLLSYRKFMKKLEEKFKVDTFLVTYYSDEFGNVLNDFKPKDVFLYPKHSVFTKKNYVSASIVDGMDLVEKYGNYDNILFCRFDLYYREVLNINNLDFNKIIFGWIGEVDQSDDNFFIIPNRLYSHVYNYFKHNTYVHGLSYNTSKNDYIYLSKLDPAQNLHYPTTYIFDRVRKCPNGENDSNIKFEKEKLLIIGSKGMLGNTALKYFQDKFNMFTLDRNTFDIFRDDLKFIKDYILKNEIDIVINCAGITRRPDISTDELYTINSYFPFYLANLSNEIGFYLVHPSTDCVFDKDNYGKSKYIAENIKGSNICIIRSSLIGIAKRGLLGWVLANNNGKIKGYKNHIWNGITTLEFCKNVFEFIKIRKTGLIKLGIEPISKYDLIKLFCDIFKLNVIVEEEYTDNVIKIVNSDKELSDIETQLKELYSFENTN